jgi:hypothetical protein
MTQLFGGVVTNLSSLRPWENLQPNNCHQITPRPRQLPNAKSKAEHEVLQPWICWERKMVRRSAFETLVRLAVVEQVTDAVCRVLEQGCRSKDDDANGWIDKRNDVESRYEAGNFSGEAEIFERLHDNGGDLSTW